MFGGGKFAVRTLMKLITCRRWEGGVSRRELLGLSITFFGDSAPKESPPSEKTPLIEVTEHHVDIEKLDLPLLAERRSLKDVLRYAGVALGATVGLWVGYKLCTAGREDTTELTVRTVSVEDTTDMELTVSAENALRVPPDVCKEAAHRAHTRFKMLNGTELSQLCPDTGGMWICDQENGIQSCHYFGNQWESNAYQVLESLPSSTCKLLCNTPEEADGLLAQRLYVLNYNNPEAKTLLYLSNKIGDRTIENPDCLWIAKNCRDGSHPTECGGRQLNLTGFADVARLENEAASLSVPDQTDKTDAIFSFVGQRTSDGQVRCMAKFFKIPFRNGLEDRFGREDGREVTLAPVVEGVVSRINASELGALSVPLDVCKDASQTAGPFIRFENFRGDVCSEPGGKWICVEDDGTHSCHYFGYLTGTKADQVLQSLRNKWCAPACNTWEEVDGVIAEQLNDSNLAGQEVLTREQFALIDKVSDRTAENPDCLWAAKNCSDVRSHPTECGGCQFKLKPQESLHPPVGDSYFSMPDDPDQSDDQIPAFVTRNVNTSNDEVQCMVKCFKVPSRS